MSLLYRYYGALRARGSATFQFLFLSCLLISLITHIPYSYSYTLTNADNGSLIRWNYGQKFFLAGNPIGRDGIGADVFFKAVTNALQQWKWATNGVMDFDYWQGTDATVYPNSLSQDGTSSIFFASNANGSTDPNIIGYTQVWFNSTTGELIEADTLLNDRDYELTSNPSDTSSENMGGWGNRPKVFLNNIITHELGHSIGLSHSTTINASMLYVEYKEQSKLGCDDWAGARHLYPSSSGETGELKGTVLSPQGDPVSGAVVTAISKDRGVPLASVLTEQNGQFHFGALAVGNAGLMIQAFQGSNASIPTRVQTRESTNICGGRYFPTQFITESDGHALKQYSVQANQVTSVNSIHIQCNSVDDSLDSLSNVPAPDMLVDIAQPGAAKTYRFIANGPFKITAIGYLLMSPIQVNITVTDANGAPLDAQTTAPLYQSKSTFQTADAQISGTAVGPIYVKVESADLPYGSYPSPAVNPESDDFFVLSFDSTGGRNIASSSELPDNARCVSPDSFSNYQSPPGNPVKNTNGTSRDLVGFCGTVGFVTDQATKNGAHYTKNGPSPSFGAILGWFFPFAVAIGSHLLRLARRRRYLLTLS